MVWYPLLGWGVFWISLVIAIILFATHKKLYPVFYLISVSLYIFTAGYFIDEFDVPKIGILMILIFSALVFMGLGLYLSKVFHLGEK